MILIVGLGNPGKEYSNTRHNVGFLIVDRLALNLDVSNFKKRFTSEYCLVSFSANENNNENNNNINNRNIKKASTCLKEELLLVKPLTFVNNSGIAVVKFFKFYKEKINRILIIHDDLDIEFGFIRFKKGGSSGGHNGVESIIRTLNSDNFDRLRFGISRPVANKDPADYVLSSFNKSEEKQLFNLVDFSVEAIKQYIVYGIEYVMNIYNKR